MAAIDQLRAELNEAKDKHIGADLSLDITAQYDLMKSGVPVIRWMLPLMAGGVDGDNMLAAMTPEQQAAHMKGELNPSKAPFAIAIAASFVMAWVLAGVIGHMGAVTVRSGLISAAFIWFGFVVTTLSVNYAFSGRNPMLTVIDSGHWLGALLVMGAVIGAFGV